MSRHRKRWLSLVAAALTAGCLHRGAPTPPPQYHPPELPLTVRGLVEPEFSPELPYDVGPPPLLPFENYRQLSARAARCLAAQASTAANQLRAEQRPPQGNPNLGCLTRPSVRRSELHNKVLAHAEEEARNQSAGLALEGYYRIAQTEGRVNLSRESLAIVEDLLAILKDLSETGGVNTQTETEAATHQRSELLTTLTQLEIGLEQGNRQMKKFLGLPGPECDYRLWPCEPLRVVRDPIDLSAAIEVGLKYRADLNLLRTLLDNLDKKTLPEARLVLTVVSPLLGGAPQGEIGGMVQALGSCLNNDEVDAVRSQIEDMLRERERDVAAEIAERVREIEARLALVLLARQRVVLAERRVLALEERKAGGSEVKLELHRARLKAIEARDGLLLEVIGWEIARTQLARAQGVLSHGCEASSPE